MDSSNLFRPAPLDLQGLRTNNREMLEREITEKEHRAANGSLTKTAAARDPLAIPGVIRRNSGAVQVTLVVASLVWGLHAAVDPGTTLGRTEVLEIGYFLARVVWGTVFVLLILLLILLQGWHTTLNSERDCWYMRLLGQGVCCPIFCHVIQNLYSPAAAEPNASRLAKMAQTKAAELAEAMPAPGAILFAGSSTFTYWKHLSEDWSPCPVINAAFGGSSVGQVNANFEQLVKRWRPGLIVYYCGVNDINAGMSAQSVVDGFKQFVLLSRGSAETASAPIIYVSTNITLLHQKMPKERQRAIASANALVREYITAERTAAANPPVVLQPQSVKPARLELIPPLMGVMGVAVEGGGDVGPGESASPRGHDGGRDSPLELQQGPATWSPGDASIVTTAATTAAGGAVQQQPLAVLPSSSSAPSQPQQLPSAGGSGGSVGLLGQLVYVNLDGQAWSNDGANYLGDGMHLNRQGHALLGQLLRPVVEPLWRAHRGDPNGGYCHPP